MDGSGIRDTTVGGTLQAAAELAPDRIALIEGLPHGPGRVWTFAALEDESASVAQTLLTRFMPGERVAVWAANTPEWIVLEFAAARAGLVLVTVNPANREVELLHVMRQSKAVALYCQQEYRGVDMRAVADRIREHLPELRDVGLLTDLVAHRVSEERPLPHVDPDDVAQIQYTSGTTGFPKGAQLTHRGLTNIARMFAEVNDASKDDIWINPMPLFHTAGCGLVTLGAVQTLGAQVLPPAFDPALMLDLFAAHRGTLMLSVPTMLLRMLDEQDQRPRDVSAWRVTALGGAPVAPELVRRAQLELGVDVTIGFGQTEASPYMAHTRPGDSHPHWQATVGAPFPGIEIRIAGPSGALLNIGEVGEIQVRGVGVMTGYLDDPESTRAALLRDGWLRTGDLGCLDDHGYLLVKGRLKDLVIRGGENIYPREVEDVLHTHTAIADVAVIGVPDDEWGESVAAFVRLHQVGTVDAEDLAAYCRARMAPFKVPRIWRFVDSFPQTASGKVQKFALRDHYLKNEATA